MYRITNGKIVTPFELLLDHDLIIREDRIAALISHQDNDPAWESCKIIDAQSGYIVPGFIDIHADYIEHIAAPRPTSMMDFSLSLHEAERELITHGITTMFHSLSLFKAKVFDTKPIRNPENVRKLIELINETHEKKHLVRHRFHARYELDNIDLVEELKEYIRDNKIHMLSFMDHTPGQGQYRDLEMFRKTIKGYRTLSDQEVDSMVTTLQTSEKLTLETLEELTALAHSKGIPVASHDDDSIDKIDLIQSFGTNISEFPITLEVAEYARERGLYTIAGAPNILLGGSHSGNLSAAEAIHSRAVNILCSDYYPAALLHAVFHMHDHYSLPLPEMVNLVTLNPARAVNMDRDYGSLEAGKKADLLIVERLDDHFPAVTTALVDGCIVLTTHYRKDEI